MGHRMRNWLLGRKPIRPEDYVGGDEAKNERVVRENFGRKAKRVLRQIPLAAEVVAGYFCMLDPKTPVWVKGTVGAALAYFILPIDALPDFLPIIGLSDDASVLAGALAAVSAFIGNDHRQKAREWLEHEQIIIDRGAPVDA